MGAGRALDQLSAFLTRLLVSRCGEGKKISYTHSTQSSTEQPQKAKLNFPFAKEFFS